MVYLSMSRLATLVMLLPGAAAAATIYGSLSENDPSHHARCAGHRTGRAPGSATT